MCCYNSCWSITDPTDPFGSHFKRKWTERTRKQDALQIAHASICGTLSCMILVVSRCGGDEIWVIHSCLHILFLRSGETSNDICMAHIYGTNTARTRALVWHRSTIHARFSLPNAERRRMNRAKHPPKPRPAQDTYMLLRYGIITVLFLRDSLLKRLLAWAQKPSMSTTQRAAQWTNPWHRTKKCFVAKTPNITTLLG